MQSRHVATMGSSGTWGRGAAGLAAATGDLVGMGVLPLVFEEGTSWVSLGLKGDETVTIHGLGETLRPRQTLDAEIRRADGEIIRLPLTCRIDTLDELEYFRNGGILPYVLRQLAA
jgi:aconitate hydratase